MTLGTSSSAVIFSLTSGAKLEVGKYGGLTAIAHSVGGENAAADYPRLFDFGDVGDSVWASGSGGTPQTRISSRATSDPCPSLYGMGRRRTIHSTLTTARRAQVVQGRRLIGIRAGQAGIPTDITASDGSARLYTTGHRHRCVHGPQASPSTTALCPSAIDSVVESIGVPGRSTHTPTSTSAATAPCRHWSIVSGGANGASQALRPAGQRDGTNPSIARSSDPYFPTSMPASRSD
jgi:hypothetical protein